MGNPFFGSGGGSFLYIIAYFIFKYYGENGFLSILLKESGFLQKKKHNIKLSLRVGYHEIDIPQRGNECCAVLPIPVSRKRLRLYYSVFRSACKGKKCTILGDKFCQ